MGKRDLAICAAAKEACISVAEMKDILIKQKDGFFEISFRDEWIIYDMFIEENSFEVRGVDSRPVPLNLLLASLPEAGQNAS